MVWKLDLLGNGHLSRDCEVHHLEGGRSDAVWSRVSQPVKEPPNPIFFCTVIGHKCRRQILDDIARLVIFEVLNIIKPRRNEMEVQARESQVSHSQRRK